ncbi:MAG TPA: HDOD domain-containing protein [Solirubrobacteraceae bacterium]|jgi:EAL and modified HD-GYP domain-containing signal transduction protein
MSDVFVARQPIFNRDLEVVGYELLFRSREAQAIPTPEGATANVVLNAFTEIGLDRIVGDRTAWINVSRDFVLNGLVQTLPSGKVRLELLEDQMLDEQLIAALAELTNEGYRVALDDFAYSEAAEPLLELVDVVKLDVLALGRQGMQEHATRLKHRGVTLLAEKVETQEDYAFCAELGCELFQGYFFCRPELLHDRGIVASRLSLLEVIAALQDPAVDIAQLERLIARDVSLSFRLLRYINSAFFGLRMEISSIRQALALLGVQNLRRWATLSVFASIDDKPPELTVTALTRGRFSELAGQPLNAIAGELFTLGMFSVIDALMDTPIDEVLASIPFPRDMREALVAHEGEKGMLLDCVQALEAGDFDRAHSLIPDAGTLYVEALVWANEAANPLFGDSQGSAGDAVAA